MALRSVMTKESLLQIIAQVENDPLAGRGSISKTDLLVDRLLAHWNTVEPRIGTTAPVRSVLTDVTDESVLDLKKTASK